MYTTFIGLKLSTDLGECGRPRRHQDLTDSVVEALHRLIIHTKETLCCPLFGHLHVQTHCQSFTTGFRLGKLSCKYQYP